jgi:hypothetical protein
MAYKPHVVPAPILNLGMRLSNKWGVQLNLRRIDQFITMVILLVKPGYAHQHGQLPGTQERKTQLRKGNTP